MSGVRRTSQRKDHYVVVFMFSSLLSWGDHVRFTGRLKLWLGLGLG